MMGVMEMPARTHCLHHREAALCTTHNMKNEKKYTVFEIFSIADAAVTKAIKDVDLMHCCANL